MTLQELIQWNRRIRIMKPKIRKAAQAGKTITKVVFYAIAIAYGLSSPYLLFSPRIGPRRLYLSKSSLEAGKFLPDEDSKKVRRSLHYLEKKKFITWKIKGNEILLKLTKEGEKRFGQILVEDITLPKQKNWDGYWRFVIFDVPRKHDAIRHMLREKLKKLGFFRIQHSVWVYPYDCEDEIRFICEYFGANRYVIMFSAKINEGDFLRKHFLKNGFRV